MNFFDLHCDTPYECYKKGQEFCENSLAVSGKAGKCFENWKQIFAVWIDDSLENPFGLYRAVIDDFKRKIARRPENLTPIMAVEGGAVIGEELDRFYILKQDGIKLLTLTWNGENAIAGGCKTDKGLTQFGKRAINKMNELKIACDLSHLNIKSFYSALEQTDFPIVTHSACYELCNHIRNLNRGQIRLLAEKGGIMGLALYPDFLTGDVFEAVYENIALFCDMGLENQIAIGSDFDGAKMDKRLQNVCNIPDLYRFLQGKGIEKELLCKIFYENADNFIAKLA
ncbi:MAG: membrane dipeptidase [Clostridia bacterium]|nr:membrane dipeptidase [Clostridia bacterium]